MSQKIQSKKENDDKRTMDEIHADLDEMMITLDLTRFEDSESVEKAMWMIGAEDREIGLDDHSITGEGCVYKGEDVAVSMTANPHNPRTEDEAGHASYVSIHAKDPLKAHEALTVLCNHATIKGTGDSPATDGISLEYKTF